MNRAATEAGPCCSRAIAGAYCQPCRAGTVRTETRVVLTLLEESLEEADHMNEKQQSEEYYAQLAEHRSRGDANEANAQGTIFPDGEPVEATGVFAGIPERETEE